MTPLEQEAARVEEKPTRAYRCRVCGGHHLTSQPISGAPERPSERSSR